MATAAQVRQVLDEMLARWNASGRSGDDVSGERVVRCVIREPDVRFRTTFAEGRFSRLVAERNGSSPSDVTVTVSADDLIALSEGRLSPVFAFLSGKLRLDASARDLVLLRQLF